MFHSCWFWLSFLIFSTHGQTDPCPDLSHHKLNDTWRSTAVIAGSVYQNDVLLTEGWYRSVSGAGGTIPLTAPNSGTCGTKNPVWMNDTLPNTGETKNASMCAVVFFSKCFPTWSTVQVKNCGSFYVYYLTTPPGDYGYCFGTETKCPVGEISETGFTPGCINVDDVVFSVSITTGLEERRGPIKGIPNSDVINLEIKFEHNIKFTDDNVNPELFLYDVNWYININLLTNCSHSLIPYANLSTTHLSETCWRDTYRMNFLVKCEVRLRGFNGRILSVFRTSDFFEAGFKTDQTSYTVAESSSIDIKITLTVPLGCVYNVSLTIEKRYGFAETHCRTVIAVQTPGTDDCSTGGVSNEAVTFGDTNCGVSISHNDWNTTKSLTVYGASDNTVTTESRSSYIRLKFPGVIPHHLAWNNVLKQDILIVVDDADMNVLNNLCYSSNDPHMRTFDGKLWENQRLKEFLLYYNEPRLYWVHAMYQSCSRWSSATCNCGVAIRNNQALFVANFCDEKIGWRISQTRSNRYVEKSFCDDTHMIINKNGNSYTIILPTGTQISFSHYYSNNNRTFISSISIKPVSS
ncbi:von Willebrand factor D and EGF domain-containing protein-like [Pecten maximus]|uniref:von Willebrand factor D and EGF domain-containing protein-like n=1 Tax=Pecten maximus TaxID=6579 RepID=UPI0014590C98|nr:von Willebrand factor D and EGF domain-containing protein-like [Pecten maximus]